MKKRTFTKTACYLFIGVGLVFGIGLVLYALIGESLANEAEEKILDKVEHRLQRKDTKLLCLDGCLSDRDKTKYGKIRHWDSDQPGATEGNDHGAGNCARASISMMVSFYGKHLSQDRIAYYMKEERADEGDGRPEGDLAHNVGMQYSACDGGEETIALEWALNEKITFIHGQPEFSALKGWLDENRPIMIRRLNYGGRKNFRHVTVVDGYRITYPGGEIKEEIHTLDPLLTPEMNPNNGWRKYPIPFPMNMAGETETIEGVWVGPVSAPNARKDEDSIRIDSDEDGIMDFDEQKRFFTNPHKADSDNDGVSDKNDIREYVFDSLEMYSKRFADPDRDGLRKEVDPDNDNDGALDGCEDSNRNGTYEQALGETNNFNPEERLAMCIGEPKPSITTIQKPGKLVHPTSAPVTNLNKPEAE